MYEVAVHYDTEHARQKSLIKETTAVFGHVLGKTWHCTAALSDKCNHSVTSLTIFPSSQNTTSQDKSLQPSQIKLTVCMACEVREQETHESTIDA